MPDNVLAFFRKAGAEGGNTRAKKYTKDQLSDMGKKGGRPRGTTKTKSEKKGK